MSTLLAFDTTVGACSVGLIRDGTPLVARSEAMARGQAELLVPMIDRVMAAAGLAYGALDAVAVTAGPGAFTGIRIGLAAARGIALAADIPALGVSTLAAFAHDVPGRVLAVIDSKRKDLFVQAFAEGAPAGDAAVAPRDGLALRGHLGAPPADSDGGSNTSLGPVRVVGDARAPAAALLRDIGIDAELDGPEHPAPRAIAALAVARLRQGAVAPPEPFYLRPAEAKLPANPALRPNR